jgi:hypothetical protein
VDTTALRRTTSTDGRMSKAALTSTRSLFRNPFARLPAAV